MQPKTPLFTSGSQYPPRFGHAVYLGEPEKGLNSVDPVEMALMSHLIWIYTLLTFFLNLGL